MIVRLAKRRSDRGCRVAIFVHRWQLLKQMSKHLFGLGLQHTVVAPGRPLARDDCYVASIDTVEERLREYAAWLRTVELLIFDEAHHALAASWLRIVDAAGEAQRVGCTATPFPPLGRVFTTAVDGFTFRDLVAAGYLSPITVHRPPTGLDLREVPMRTGDYVPEALAQVLDNPAIIEPAVQHYARLRPHRPAVMFGCTVLHAQHIADQFRAAGFRAAAVDGSLHESVQSKRLAALATGEIEVLASCDLISEGQDTPSIELAGMLRPTRSLVTYRQQTGRAARRACGKGSGVLLDMVGNVDAHGLPDEDFGWSLAEGLLRPPISVTRTCVACFAVVLAGEHASCPICGDLLGAEQRTNPASPGPKRTPMRCLAHLTDRQVNAMQQRSLLRLVRGPLDLWRIAQVKGYKAGWVRCTGQRLGYRL